MLKPANAGAGFASADAGRVRPANGSPDRHVIPPRASKLSNDQRKALEEALLDALCVRYPGRAIVIEWNEPDALGDVEPAPWGDQDRFEQAA